MTIATTGKYSRLRLILGDQLNARHSWFASRDEQTLYVMMECLSETGYVRHHIQKVTGFFLAMRHFAGDLRRDDHQVLYLTLDDQANRQRIDENLRWIIADFGIEKFEYQLPDEFRLDELLKRFCRDIGISTQVFDTEHFLGSRTEVRDFFQGKKQYLMESFYRHMRRRYRLLMEPDGRTPLTGRWNYDQENRQKLPPDMPVPPGPDFRKDAGEIVRLLHEMKVETIGKIDADRFNWPINRQECLHLLDHFIRKRLVHFGRFQDAMTSRDEWLFHSRLSFALNTKMLHPLEVIHHCIAYWEAHPGIIDIAQIEGFVRQIIGWREYMRGIYWAEMPAYEKLNYFDHQAPLPAFFWTGKTRMRCVQHAVSQSLETGYAHHIQRLMVTGNIALLLGVHPDEVDAWYLGIYMDAVEWVEITNTRGMSQFADGGIVGTKPYVSTANYIDKMSDYCQNCHYDKSRKYGPRACPFNSLYWDFYERHREKLRPNPRIGMMYRTWDRMTDRKEILDQAAYYRRHAGEL